jgi:hypothetical protein
VRRVCLLLVVAACGRLDFEQHEDITSNDAIVDEVRCGSTVVLDDPFDDMTDAPLFTVYNNPGMSTSEAGGAVSFVFSPSVGAGRYSGYDSAFYSLQDFCATAEVSDVPSDEGLAYFDMVGGAQKVEFISYRGNLELRTVTSGAPNGVGLFPLDATQKFWRLRQQGAVTYWDVSADNITFVNLAMTTFFAQTMVKVSMGAGAVMTATNAGQFTVNQVHVTAP